MSNIMIPKVNVLDVKSNLNDNDLILIEDSEDNYNKKKVLASNLISSGNSNVYKLSGVLGEDINTGAPVCLEDRGSGLKIYKLQQNSVVNNYLNDNRWLGGVNLSYVSSQDIYVKTNNFSNNMIYLYAYRINALKQPEFINLESIETAYGSSWNNLAINNDGQGVIAYRISSPSHKVKIKAFTVDEYGNFYLGNSIEFDVSSSYDYISVAIKNNLVFVFYDSSYYLNLAILNINNNIISLIGNAVITDSVYCHHCIYNTISDRFMLSICKDGITRLLTFDTSGNLLYNISLFSGSDFVYLRENRYGDVFASNNQDLCIVSKNGNIKGLILSNQGGSNGGSTIDYLGENNLGLYFYGGSFKKFIYNGLSIEEVSSDYVCNIFRAYGHYSTLHNCCFLSGSDYDAPYHLYKGDTCLSLKSGSVSKYIGLLELGGNTGDTRNVILANGIHSNISGLEAGKIYYIDYFGNLTTTPQRWKAYKALNSTTAIVLY